MLEEAEEEGEQSQLTWTPEISQKLTWQHTPAKMRPPTHTAGLLCWVPSEKMHLTLENGGPRKFRGLMGWVGCGHPVETLGSGEEV